MCRCGQIVAKKKDGGLHGHICEFTNNPTAFTSGKLNTLPENVINKEEVKEEVKEGDKEGDSINYSVEEDLKKENECLKAQLRKFLEEPSSVETTPMKPKPKMDDVPTDPPKIKYKAIMSKGDAMRDL